MAIMNASASKGIEVLITVKNMKRDNKAKNCVADCTGEKNSQAS